MQAAEDKVSHLSNIKTKLEQTMDELQDSYEREKRARADIEKQRRKTEGELKVTQEGVSDLERTKKELESNIARKEKDLGQLSTKLEDEQEGVSDLERTKKELESNIARK